MPEMVEMRRSIPPELGPETEVLAELRQRVQAVEAAVAAERRRTGRRVFGRRAVLAQSWRDQPSSVEPRRNLRSVCENQHCSKELDPTHLRPRCRSCQRSHFVHPLLSPNGPRSGHRPEIRPIPGQAKPPSPFFEFGRFAAKHRKQANLGAPETFNFLGFTHACGTTKQGKFLVERRTMQQRM